MEDSSILRFQLAPYASVEPQAIQMPKGAEVIDAVWQEGRSAFSVYALAKNAGDGAMETRYFVVRETGASVKSVKHIRTIVMPDGFFVYHVMEVVG
jgi:hypothetical protein